MIIEVKTLLAGTPTAADLKYGIELGVKEAPAFFINGKKFEGNVSMELLNNKIIEVLKE